MSAEIHVSESATDQKLSLWGIRLPLFRWVQMLCFALMGLVLLVQAGLPARPSTLTFVVETPTAGELQVYFDQSAGYSEANSSKVVLEPGRNTVVFELPPGNTQALRIDPAADMRELAINHVSVQGSSSQVSDDDLLSGIHAVHEMEGGTAADGKGRYLITADATDPQLQLTPAIALHSSSEHHVRALEMSWVLFGLALVLALGLQLGVNGRHLNLAAVAFGLTLSLACLAITAYSVSPDEVLHEADASYFNLHWAPPDLQDPQMQTAYAASPYGVSYLAEWNVTYLLAGKFGNVLHSLDVAPRTAYRLYQAALFGSLIALLFLLRLPQPVAIPLIVTPQLWYLFSYMNGDALPFAAAFLGTALACVPGSRIAAFMSTRSAPDRTTLLHLTLFVLCFATLLISKRNYWPIAGFLAVAAAIVPFKLNLRMVSAISTIMLITIVGAAGGAALVETYGQGIAVAAAIATLACAAVIAHGALRLLRHSAMGMPVLRYASVFLSALLLASPWVIGDYVKNGAGTSKQAVVDHMREVHAAPQFKPSSNTQMPTLRLHTQGTPLHALLTPPLDWHKTTFRSFFGGYGYMQYFAGSTYYWLMAIGVVGLIGICVLSTLLFDPLGKRYFVLAGAAAASLVLASLLHSWTYDFQAQGRYVIGILVLTVPFMFHLQVSRRLSFAANIVAAALFVLSCYSFACIALPALTA